MLVYVLLDYSHWVMVDNLGWRTYGNGVAWYVMDYYCIGTYHHFVANRCVAYQFRACKDDYVVTNPFWHSFAPGTAYCHSLEDSAVLANNSVVVDDDTREMGKGQSSAYLRPQVHLDACLILVVLKDYVYHKV